MALLTAHSGPAESLDTQYASAVQEAREAHAARMEQLDLMYQNHLERLIAAAQPRGDIESIVLFLDEKENTGAGGDHADLVNARQSLYAQRSRFEERLRGKLLRIEERYKEMLEAEMSSLTREGRIEDAMALNDALEEVRGRIEALRPPEPEKPDEPETPRVGDNIFPQGDMEDEDRWRVSSPGGRNRTGFHSESRHETGAAARNQTLRFDMHENRRGSAHHRVPLRNGQTYQLTWRARLLRPWRQGIELRGKGHYMIGVRINGSQWRAFTPQQQLQIRRYRRFQITPPDSTDWESHSRTFEAGPHMDEFFITVSSGEGDFLIDDVEIRPILDD